MQLSKKLQWLLFDQLSLEQLYSLLKLRSDVFVVEQICAYPDLDDLDQKAYHGLLYEDEKLIGYIRVYQKSEAIWTFGRIVVNPHYRKLKLGVYLVELALDKIKQLHPGAVVVIGAQAHLERYYQRFGFIKSSQPYDDYGIMHIDMTLQLN
ncbi:GNAT family N-acetyltransferase [Thiotrichales bacterium 19S3-7]|nr:GNAT family N-acetyltransferase [Thiotrichales bacterium 19S3-7]MCF6800907.1 GNAT family N-acetyltransferase [Thiotrichales bacterium 19S3-11]